MGKPSYASEWSGGFYPGFSGFRPPLMKDRLDINEIVLKGPKIPNQKKKKKKKWRLSYGRLYVAFLLCEMLC